MPGEAGDASDAIAGDGTFIKKGTYIRLDAVADVTGGCQLRAWSYWPKQCVTYRSELRSVSKVSAVETPPGLLSSIYSIFPITPSGSIDNQRQHLDTQAAGTTTGPVTNLMSELGTWKYQSQAVVYVTNCNLLPDRSELQERHLNVSNCAPMWWRLGGGPGGSMRNPHFAPGEWTVYLDPVIGSLLSNPATNAGNDWGAKATGSGVSFRTVG